MARAGPLIIKNFFFEARTKIPPKNVATKLEGGGKVKKELFCGFPNHGAPKLHKGAMQRVADQNPDLGFI